MGGDSVVRIQSVVNIAIVLFLVVIFPNSIMWMASVFYGVGRTYINIDYAVLVLPLLSGRWFLAGVLAVFFLVVDMLCLAGQVFPFMRMADLTYLLRFLWVAPVAYKVWFLLAVLLLVSVFFSSYFSRSIVPKLPALIVLNVLLVVYISSFLFGNGEGDRFWRTAPGKIVDSQSFKFWRARFSGFLENFEMDNTGAVPFSIYKNGAATDVWRKELGDSLLGDRLLLVVNESWGVPLNERLQEEILRPLLSLKGVEISQGMLSFGGATVEAELRELCKLQPNYFGFRDAADDLRTCLPNELQRYGYKTFGMHGATGMMYDRKDWYPQAGFEADIFYEDMLGARRCFSFPGACDRDLFSRLDDYFYGAGRRFFYWMTLNTHASYDERDIVEDLISCESYGVDEESESCRNLKLQAQFFSGLARQLMRPSMSGVDVIVVGDHEPRLTNRHEKERNFQNNAIPWIRIIMR